VPLVQHLFCSIRGNAILDSHFARLSASLQKTGAGSFSKQSILKRPARPRERECSAGYFFNQPPEVGVSEAKGKLTMRSLLILVAICFSATAFAQSAPPKIGNKRLVQEKPKEPMGGKLVGTNKITSIDGDCWPFSPSKH